MVVNRRQFLSIFSSVAFLRVSLTHAQSKYSETILALKTAYKNEIQAHLNYVSYAEKAKQENYPGIGHLFISFATSESIHARNFREVLSTLGVRGWEPPRPEVMVSSTKKNLKNALEFEIKDIDGRYPQLYQMSKPENHETAIRNILYAWDSEKQHRDLIEKILSGTGIFFGILAKKIEATSVQYFVCQLCGSTMTEVPKDNCPICKSQASRYKEIERIK
jgi:rubrerythrin